MKTDYLSYSGTFSKNPEFFGFEPGLTITEAHGSKIKLSTGEWLTDWISGLGASILGYAPHAFTSAISNQLLWTGPALSLPHHLEYEAAEKLCYLLGYSVPGWQADNLAVRWGKTGSDATTMAVRLARAVTGRHWILAFKGHYHGWGNWTVGRTPPAHGVYGPGVTEVNWGDREALAETMDSDLACVIFEVGIADPDPEYLRLLRRLCHDHGVLLIVDEVVTGLRYGMGGACERYGIEPDLVCMGKALGNGMPISALVGPREYMDWFRRDDPVFCSSTHFGEPISLAAADYVISNWSPEKVAHLWWLGAELIEGMRGAGWQCIGHGARSLMTFDSDEERAFFIQGMRARGHLFNRPNFPTLATTEQDVISAVEAAREVRADLEQLGAEELKRAVEGKLPRVLFRGR